MTLTEFLQYLTWGIYLAIFVSVGLKAARDRSGTHVDIALFFFLPALSIGIRIALKFGWLVESPALAAASAASILAMPYLLVRLVDDFEDVPAWVLRASEVTLALFVVANFAFSEPPGWLVAAEILYLIGLFVYATLRFALAAQRTHGVTRRRMASVAIGSMWLVVVMALAGIGPFWPDASALMQTLSQVAGLASALSYYIGFATPAFVRHAWQQPELRAFLGRAATLPRLPTARAIIEEVEAGASASLGVSVVRVGLWDEAAGVLRFEVAGRVVEATPSSGTVAGRAFLSQKAVLQAGSGTLTIIHPDLAPQPIRAALSAPITAGGRRLGVLAVYAPRAPVFGDDDLSLTQLLADQAAVVLESRSLIDEAARVQAREHVTRLKEDFLSAAAHDLRTPLTILVAQSELLERRAQRQPDAPTDVVAIRRMKTEAHRLKTLVVELLDAARVEQGKLTGERSAGNLVAVAKAVCLRHNSARHPCIVDGPDALEGVYDEVRIEQLLDNLIENAVKYSPEGGPVLVRLWQENGSNRISVRDCGIGIPDEDLPVLFERFHRGANVNDRYFSGMGLGLFICRAIVREHGGEIWVETRQGAKDEPEHEIVIAEREGSDAPVGGADSALAGDCPTGTTFHVSLPC